MGRHEAREAIITEIKKEGLMSLMNFHSWNQPVRYTELILEREPELAEKWKMALEIMEKYAPSDDTKKALSLYK